MFDFKSGLPLFLSLFFFGGGYVAGCDGERAQGRAALETIKREHADAMRQSAETYAGAVTDLFADYRDEVKRADGYVTRMAANDKEHDAETRTLRRRIADATNGSRLVLGPDVVRMLNEAAGACVSDAAGSGTVYPSGADGGAGGSAPPCAGVLERFDGVSEADLTAWFLRYARRTRWLETRYAAWKALFSQQTGENQ